MVRWTVFFRWRGAPEADWLDLDEGVRVEALSEEEASALAMKKLLKQDGFPSHGDCEVRKVTAGWPALGDLHFEIPRLKERISVLERVLVALLRHDHPLLLEPRTEPGGVLTPDALCPLYPPPDPVPHETLLLKQLNELAETVETQTQETG